MNYRQLSVHAAFFVLLGSFSAAQAESPPTPVAVGNEKAELIAQKKCVKCHSEDGNARAPMYPKIAGQNEQYLAQTMRAYRDGSRYSPIMTAQINEERSSDADIAVLAAYYAEKSRCAPAAAQQGSTVGVVGDYAAGQKVAEGLCTQCHQVTGQLVNPIWPKIAGQNAYYIRSSVTAYRDGQRKNDTMSPMVKHLTDADIANVAVFYASQKVCQPGQM